MHIVRVRHLFYPDMPRDYFYELSARQVKMGHEVDVLTWNRNGNFPEEALVEGFTVHRLPGLNFSLDGMVQDYPYLPELPARIEMLKPEIVHAESHLFLTTVQAVRKARNLGIPSVVTVHGVFFDRGIGVNFAQHVYNRSWGLSVLRKADRIICLTRSDAKEIIRLGCAREKITLVPNAADTELFKPCKEREDNLIVWCGRFVPQKGLKYLIEAAKIVARNFKDVKFLLVGYGPLKSRIIKLANDWGLLERYVYFREPLSRDELARVLGKATIFVFPSLSEGMPVIVLEAMASGAPVIGSDIPGIKAIISDQHNGVLVPSRNPEALANAIFTLLDDENLRRKLGQNARQLTVEKYSWDAVIDRIERVYNEAIKEER